MASGTGLSRHHRAPLSRERVLLEAVALADKAGLGSLTMRRLADRLHVEPMSLYYHVAGKDEIFDGMVDLVFAEVELPPAGAEWKTAMRDRAASARAALRRHPWAIGLMDSRLNAGPATLRHHDAVIGCLRGPASPSSWRPMRSRPSTATSTVSRGRSSACPSAAPRKPRRWP